MVFLLLCGSKNTVLSMKNQKAKRPKFDFVSSEIKALEATKTLLTDV
jgi:hypothetical protein